MTTRFAEAGSRPETAADFAVSELERHEWRGSCRDAPAGARAVISAANIADADFVSRALSSLATSVHAGSRVAMGAFEKSRTDMPKHNRRPPDLLEVTRSDGTLVMDCNSGIALLVLPPKRNQAAANDAVDVPTNEAQDGQRARSRKSKRPRN